MAIYGFDDEAQEISHGSFLEKTPLGFGWKYPLVNCHKTMENHHV